MDRKQMIKRVINQMDAVQAGIGNLEADLEDLKKDYKGLQDELEYLLFDLEDE